MEEIIHVPFSHLALEGMLRIPEEAFAIVLFAHGSGSSRFSPRNNFVANVLFSGGLGTLLIDLLTAEEDQNYQMRFDIDLLAERLKAVVEWLSNSPHTHNLIIGLFGSSTGAAAALQVAAAMKSKVKAVVSRGGRPDLAMKYLPKVTASTLFIVGGNDDVVIELNQSAYQLLSCRKEFIVIQGATHLFEEPGCLEEVARLANEWFQIQLAAY